MQEGMKFDEEKPDMAYLIEYFPDALVEVVRVSEFGAKKYSKGNWKFLNDNIRRYTSALLRHLFEKDVFDNDSKLRHSAHTAWNSLAKLQLEIERDREKQNTTNLPTHNNG